MTEQGIDADRDTAVGDVTRLQGGQSIDESERLIRPEDRLEATLDAPADAHLLDRDASTVTAMQVTIERGGAEAIYADKTFLNNSGANRIEGSSAKLTQSGVLRMDVDSAELYQSSAMTVDAETVHMDQGTIIFATAETVQASAGVDLSMVQARNVRADGDIRAFAIFGKSVEAGGTITTTMSAGSAAAFGAGCAGVWLLAKWLGGRTS